MDAVIQIDVLTREERIPLNLLFSARETFKVRHFLAVL